VLQALAYLVLAGVFGMGLAVLPPSEATLRLAFVYGVCGLLGFLCQLILGIEARLLPLAAWLHGFAGSAYRELPPSLHTAMPLAGPAAAFALWTLGVPALACGLGQDLSAWVRVGAGALALAVIVVAASGVRALLRLRAPLGRPVGSV